MSDEVTLEFFTANGQPEAKLRWSPGMLIPQPGDKVTVRHLETHEINFLEVESREFQYTAGGRLLSVRFDCRVKLPWETAAGPNPLDAGG